LEDIIVRVNAPKYRSKLYNDAVSIGGVQGFLINYGRRRTELANYSSSMSHNIS
jgi:hypothetical protein